MGRIKQPPWAASVCKGHNRGPGDGPRSLLEVTLACEGCWGGGEGLEPGPGSEAGQGAAPHALREIWGLLASRHAEPNSGGKQRQES